MSAPTCMRVRRAKHLLLARVLSDRTKTKRAPLQVPANGHEILQKLAELPISTWTYLWDPDARHLGPMAQDFAAAFGLGDDDRWINKVDANGVLMVSVQALYRRVIALEAEVAALRHEI